MISSFILALVTVVSLMIILFIFALIKRDNSIVDIAYGLLFVIAASVAMTAFGELSTTSLIAYILLFIWGARLSARIISRNFKKGEDWRYVEWRNKWMQKGYGYFVFRSFFQIYVLQGIIILVVLLPILAAISTPTASMPFLAFLGVAVWIIGFLFESIGDEQLDAFIKKPENKGKIMQYGLWKYTRHPNYFGEMTMWWGMWILAVGVSWVYWWTILSPLLITFLLLKVSGVPLLEKKWDGNEEFEVYKSKTSAVFPWKPKN